MKWIGERISFIDDNKKTTVIVEPEQKLLVNALMGAWVSMWFVIGGISIWALVKLGLTDQETIILYVFLSFWAYYAYRVTRAFLWLIWGKESIKIDETGIILKNSIRGYGRATPYYFQNVEKIRMMIPKERSLQTVWESSPWVKGGERIEFDYMGRVVRFGKKLNEKDAKLLFKLITKKVSERMRKSKI